MVTAIISVITEHDDPVVQHDSALTGRAYYDELLATPSWARFHDVARMDRNVFFQLLHILTTEGGLEDSEKVCAGEKVLYLINALCGWSNRMLNERWQHSGSTLSIYIHDVIQSILRCKKSSSVDQKIYLKMTRNSTPTLKIVLEHWMELISLPWYQPKMRHHFAIVKAIYLKMSSVLSTLT